MQTNCKICWMLSAHHNDLVNFMARQSLLFECGRSLLGRYLQFCSDRYRLRLRNVFDDSFNINRIIRKYCEEKEKGKEVYLYSAILSSISKRLDMDHSFTCKLHHS